jgi:hypothetical protein
VRELRERSFWFLASTFAKATADRSFQLSYRVFKPASSPKPRQKPKILAPNWLQYFLNRSRHADLNHRPVRAPTAKPTPLYTEPMAKRMPQRRCSPEPVNTSCNAIGSPHSNRKAARMPAKTRNTIRVSRCVIDDELFIKMKCLDQGERQPPEARSQLQPKWVCFQRKSKSQRSATVRPAYSALMSSLL